jgi:hypothetical protein
MAYGFLAKKQNARFDWLNYDFNMHYSGWGDRIQDVKRRKDKIRNKEVG